MAIPAGSAVVALNDSPALKTAAANAIANGGFCNAADVVVVAQAVNVNGCRLCRIEVRATFSGAGTMKTNPSMIVWARLKSRDGSSWESTPDANNKRHRICTLKVDPDNIATEQILIEEDCPIPVEADYELWLENDSGRDVPSGWDHEMQAFSYNTST